MLHWDNVHHLLSTRQFFFICTRTCTTTPMQHRNAQMHNTTPQKTEEACSLPEAKQEEFCNFCNSLQNHKTCVKWFPVSSDNDLLLAGSSDSHPVFTESLCMRYVMSSLPHLTCPSFPVCPFSISRIFLFSLFFLSANESSVHSIVNVFLFNSQHITDNVQAYWLWMDGWCLIASQRTWAVPCSYG